MGIYVNPNNIGFEQTVNSQIYVDKTGMIKYLNQCINTEQKFICVSRARRFGKSVTAGMIKAYYSKGCDSSKLFAGREIEKDSSYKKYLNKYDVIHFDMQWFVEPGNDVNHIVAAVQNAVLKELKEVYSDIVNEEVTSLPDAMSLITEKTGNKFIVIIDEWDVLIRDEAMNQKVQDEYIGFLRKMFKGTEPTKYISIAYLTGILPIKKLKTQSALNNFDEFTMLDAGEFAPFVGFTEDEVEQLSLQYDRNFPSVEQWYDGYLLSGQHVYNPKAVVSVMKRGIFQSYWSKTGTFESIRPFINMDFDGLKTAIIKMISGDAVAVDTSSFQNDMVSFESKDDVLTLLIHLGILPMIRKITLLLSQMKK